VVQSADSMFVVNGVTVDPGAGILRDASGTEVPLRAQSFAVLRELARHAGSVVEKDALIAAVWRGVAVTDDSLVQCIGEIRRALRDEAQTVLKTVPRRGYRLIVPVVAPVAVPQRGGNRLVAMAVTAVALIALVIAAVFTARPAPQAENPPSIAVLPFDDMSSEGNLGYMGAGVAEDIIAMLARSPGVLVIARNSSFVYGAAPVDLRKVGTELGVDYVLEGSVRREGDRLRIVAQLNDAHTGQHVWAERFDQTGSDPSALQDGVTGLIIASLIGEDGELKRAQYREAWGKDTSSLGEYDYFLRGLDVFINAETKAENDRGGRIWKEGLEKYPDSVLLKVKLGWYHWQAAWNFWSDDMNADYNEAGRLVREVLATDNLSPEVRRVAYWLNSFILMREGAFAGAVQQAKATVAMAPYDARVLRTLTYVLISDGEYEIALAWLDIAETRDPFQSVNFPIARANLYRLMGRNEDAIAAYSGVVDPLPEILLSEAIVHVRLGQMDEAKAKVRKALETQPEFTQRLWRKGWFYSDPAILDAETADLAAAGLPD
jgi:adenylate cyclase